MKNSFIRFFIVALSLLGATGVYAHDFEADGIYYNIISTTDLTAEVTNGLFVYAGDIVIPEKATYQSRKLTVINICENAFKDCTGLTGITIPKTVKKIGHYAFNGCTGLKELTIEDGHTPLQLGYNTYDNSYPYTGKGLFRDCPLETLYLGRDLSYDSDKEGKYGYSPFYDINTLTTVTISDSVTNIGKYAFSSCDNLKSITIPNNVTRIDDNAFTTLKELILEDGQKTLSLGNYNRRYYDNNGSIAYGIESLFYYCPLETLYLGRNLSYGATSSEGFSPFYKRTDLTSVTIGDSVTTIGKYAFSNCTGLTNVTIGNSVNLIEEDAFNKCIGLTSIEIPNSVTSIGGFAFSGCTGLTSIKIPDNATSTGDYAFRGCTGLTSVIIGNNVKNIGNGSFNGCTGLTSIEIPGSITSIGEEAFYGCAGLTSIEIPDSVTSIGNSAFYDCVGLTSVTIGNNVTSIGKSAFYGCKGLTSITIPDNVIDIGESAFFNSGLTDVIIGSSVTSIGGYAFDCYNLVDIYTKNEVPIVCEENIFSNYYRATLHVPAGCTATYSETAPWNKFKNIVEEDYTAVENIATDSPCSIDGCIDGVYSIQGKLIYKGSVTLKSLPSGVYIINGRKVIVK